MNLRKILRSSSVVSWLYYSLHIDDLQVLMGTPAYMMNVREALSKWGEDANLSIINDMKRSYWQCKASPEEYFLLDLQHADKVKRKSFVTDKFMYMTLGRIVGRKRHDREIEDKWGFYNLAKDYFKREVIIIKGDEDYSSFLSMALRVKHLICKPNDEALGSGIFAAHVEGNEDARTVFNSMVQKGGTWIVEERIKQDERMAVWNDSSVNTVRVCSFLNAEGFFIITPFLRTGRKGSVVDNAGAGGVFANVDYDTGKLESDGIDEMGRYYSAHPDSGVVFKGWQIPQWDLLLATVEKIHKECMPSHPYIGWDFALSKDNEWCVIEANWGQFVNQYIDKIGRKEEFLRYVKAKPYKKK